MARAAKASGWAGASDQLLSPQLAGNGPAKAMRSGSVMSSCRRARQSPHSLPAGASGTVSCCWMPASGGSYCSRATPAAASGVKPTVTAL